MILVALVMYFSHTGPGSESGSSLGSSLGGSVNEWQLGAELRGVGLQSEKHTNI